MSRSTPSIRAIALAAALAAGAAPLLPAYAATPATASAAQSEQRLDKLAAQFYDARAKYDPMLYATANGDGRYDDQLGMAIAPKVRARYLGFNHQLLKQMHGIDRARLAPKAQLNYDILASEIQSQLDLEKFPEHLLPLNHFDNMPSNLANYAGGTGSQPLNTPAQYRAYLSRLNQLPAWIDQAIANMKEGIRQKVVQPKSITAKMLPQFRELHSATPEASIFATPVKHFPAGFSEQDQRALTAGYTKAAANINAALGRLNAFLEKDYMAAGRTTAGYSDLPNGAAWYQARIKNNTNLDLTPAQIHELGLKEVARIQQQMATLAPKLGYDGPANKFAQWVAAQDKFKPFKTEQQVLDGYRQIYAKVQTKLPEYFSLVPKAKL
ncbi:MAG TPA: DUF885 domain-containing protein, partial [Telluria sp.]|nr:DUF885 domain-containing protein [Telluria sp.]